MNKMTEEKLKENLEKLAKNNFQPAEESSFLALIPEMLQHIGSLDSHLRDDLIYTAFATWVLKHKAIPKGDLHKIFQTVVSDAYMFKGIGEQGTDTVFQRSFSVLLLPILLIAHREDAYLTSEEVLEIKDKLIAFVKLEKDRRGYVEGKGWAHSMAHAADALDDIARCEEISKVELIELLDAIKSVVCEAGIGYAYGEEERSITPIIAILNRELVSNDEVKGWIESLAEVVQTTDPVSNRIVMRTNVKNFLQSLYFRLRWEGITEFDGALHKALQQINPFANQGG
jgi:hypothetical protein